MTNCKDKCWCKKFNAKAPDADSPPLLQDLYVMAHKIDHLYDGVEKCFKRIEDLEDRVTGISVCVCQLETNVDFEKVKELVYAGAQTHASILKLQGRLKELEDLVSTINANVSPTSQIEMMVKLNVENLHKRIDELEKNGSKGDKKPYVCPRCNDLTDCDMCASTGLVWG